MENKEREILQFTPEEASDILCEDSNDFEVIVNEQYDSGRWASYHSLIVKRKSDGKYFETTYSQGLTESQWHSPFDEDDCTFKEVVPVEEVVTITKYIWNEK